MPTINNVKATFVGLSQVRKKELKTQHGLILVSIGEERQSHEAFKAALRLINTYLSSVTLVICDSLQRYNLPEFTVHPQLAEKLARKLGDRWLIDNIPAINELNIPYKIKRWNDYLYHKNFKNAKNKINGLLKKSKQKKLLSEGLGNLTSELLEKAAVTLCFDNIEDCNVIICSEKTPSFFSLLKEKKLFKNAQIEWMQISTRGENKKKNEMLYTYLSDNNNLYYKILNLLPNNFYWLDKNNHYMGCNNNQAKEFGLKSSEEVIGKTNRDFFNKEDAETLDKINLCVMHERLEVEIEETVHYHHQLRTFISKKIPIFDEFKNVIGLLGISFDITEKKLKEQIQKTQQALNSRMQFIAIASHEIRGPVANAISYLSLNQDLKKELQKECDLVLKQALRESVSQTLLTKIQKMLDMLDSIEHNHEISKEESYRALAALKNLGDLYQLKTKPEKAPPLLVPAIHFFESLIHQFENNARAITLQYEVSSEIPKNSYVDVLLQKALEIVVNNAIRFSQKGSSIEILVHTLKNNFLSIKVQDKGIGMSKEHLDNLFSSFLDEESDKQNQNYSKPSIQLSIAKTCLETIGGNLTLTSQLEKGTTVTIKVPYHTNSATTSLKNNQSNPTIKENKKNRMLIVEDDPLTLELEKTQLESLGHTVDTASNGKTAIKLLQENLYRIVFLDITLPDTNGLEIIKMAQDTINAETPYVALTSHANQEDKDHFILEGMFSDVISKPITKNQFQDCIEAIEEALEESDV